MKITNVTVHMLSAPIPPARQHRTDLGQAVKAEAAVVEVRTDEGLSGIGPAFGSPPVIRAAVESELRSCVMGQDPCAVEALWERMYCGSRAAVSCEGGYAFPRIHRRGETIAAMSGIDVACWDIAGQAVGLPIYKILGAYKDKQMAYASSAHLRTVEEYGPDVLKAKAEGFKAYKIHPGSGQMASGPAIPAWK